MWGHIWLHLLRSYHVSVSLISERGNLPLAWQASVVKTIQAQTDIHKQQTHKQCIRNIWHIADWEGYYFLTNLLLNLTRKQTFFPLRWSPSNYIKILFSFNLFKGTVYSEMSFQTCISLVYTKIVFYKEFSHRSSMTVHIDHWLSNSKTSN